MEKTLKIEELVIDKSYDLKLTREIENPETKEKETKEAVVANLKVATILLTSAEDAKIFRFESVVNQSMIFMDHEMNLKQDYAGWKVAAITESEPLFIKNIVIKETEFATKATETFGDDAEKVISFIKDLEADKS